MSDTSNISAGTPSPSSPISTPPPGSRVAATSGTPDPDDADIAALIAQFATEEAGSGGPVAPGGPNIPATATPVGAPPVNDGTPPGAPTSPLAGPTSDLATDVDPTAGMGVGAPGGDTDNQGGESDQGGDQGETVYTIDGVEMTEADLAHMAQIRNWLSQLSPEQVNSIDNLFSGKYQLQPTGYPQGPPNPPQGYPPSGYTPEGYPQSPQVFNGTPQGQPGQPQQGQPQFSPGTPQGNPYEDYLDPRAAADIASLRAQLSALQAAQESATREAQQSHYRTVQQAIDTSAQQFATTYSLTPTQLSELNTAVAQSGILPGIASRTPDPATAFTQALEYVMWTNPTYRQQAIKAQIASEVTSQVTQQLAPAQQQQQRTTKASSLMGAGGGMPKSPAAPANRDNNSAMVAEIASYLNGNTPPSMSNV